LAKNENSKRRFFEEYWVTKQLAILCFSIWKKKIRWSQWSPSTVWFPKYLLLWSAEERTTWGWNIFFRI